MTQKQDCEKVAQLFNDLRVVQKEIADVLSDKKNHHKRTGLREKAEFLLTEMQAYLPAEVFFDKWTKQPPIKSFYDNEESALKSELDVNWKLLQPVGFSSLFGVFEKNGKYYFLNRPIFIKSKTLSATVGGFRAREFNNKESLKKYLLRFIGKKQIELSDSEKEQLLNKIET